MRMKTTVPLFVLILCPIILHVDAAFPLGAPIYVVNDRVLDADFTLDDFYLYQGTLFNFSYIRLTNSGLRYFEWIEVNVDLLKNGAMTATQVAFMEYSTYGTNGLAPGTTGYTSVFVKDVEFDSVVFRIKAAAGDGKDYIFNDQALQVFDTKLEKITGSTTKASGSIKSVALQEIQFPTVYICAFKSNRMIYDKMAFVDIGGSKMQPQQVGTFSAMLDLPPEYDEMRYYPNYAVFATGNVSVGVNAEETVVWDYGLEQNYPNPFNSSTVIRYSVPAPAQLTLTAYDLLGRKVMNLFNGRAEPGTHAITWHADGLASGHYIIRLETAETVKTMRCTIIR